MSGLLAASRALLRWQWGAREQARQCPPTLHDPAGMASVSSPRCSAFFSAPHCVTRCKAGSRDPFPPPTTVTVQGEPGNSMDLWVWGKETGLLFPAPSPPLRPAPPPFFPARGHSTRRFWKVSLKAGGGGTTELGLNMCSPRETEPPGRRANRSGYVRLRGRSRPFGECHPDRWSAWLGSWRCTCWPSLSSN